MNEERKNEEKKNEEKRKKESVYRIFLEMLEANRNVTDVIVRERELGLIANKRVVMKREHDGALYEFLLKDLIVEREKDFDSSLVVGGYRFRVNVATYEGTKKEITLRWLKDMKVELPSKVKEISLGIVRKCELKQGGLFLVIGPTGSGKSTTIMAMLNFILENFPARVVTIEDPVEYVIKPGKGWVLQREVGVDVDSFVKGLRSALRQNPNIIFVGEVRDRETAELLMQASDTGHVVMATLHTDRAKDACERLINMVEAERRELYVKVFVNNLIGILGTRLFDVRGKKVLVYEYLNVEGDSAVQSLILQEQYGMLQTYANNMDKGHLPFEYSIAELLCNGKIGKEDVGKFPVSESRVFQLASKLKL